MKIQGTGFILRGWQQGDEASLQKNANNPKVSAWLLDRFPYPYTMEDAEIWVNTMSPNIPPLTNLAIVINDEVCGGIGLELMIDANSQTAEVGYWLAEPYWGRGIATEALKLMTRYAFKQFDIIRLQAGVFSGNTSSMRVLEKAGFVKEGVMYHALVKRGQPMDKHMYAILKGQVSGT